MTSPYDLNYVDMVNKYMRIQDWIWRHYMAMKSLVKFQKKKAVITGN